MHTLKEDECGIYKGWKQLVAGRPNTHNHLSSSAASLRLDTLQLSPFGKNQKTQLKTLASLREKWGRRSLADHFGVSDLLETLDLQTKIRSWMYSLISHTTNSFLKKNRMK